MSLLPSETTQLAATPQKRGHDLSELSEAGYGCRSFLYIEIAEKRLRAIKRGRRTIVLEEDLQAWLSKLPEAKITKPKRKKAA